MASIQDTIVALEKRLQQAKAKAKQIEASRKKQLAKEERAKDTRRKILVGSVAISKMDRGELLLMLDTALTRSDDRALFDLQPIEPLDASVQR